MRTYSIVLSLVLALVTPALAGSYEDGRLVPISPVTVNMFQAVGIGNVVWEHEFSFPDADFIRFRLDDISDASSGNYQLVVRDIDHNVLVRIESSTLEGKQVYWSDILYTNYVLMQVEKTDKKHLLGFSFSIREFVVEGGGRIKFESHDGSPVWVDVYKTHNDKIWELSRSIAKLSVPQGRRNRACSGFLIGPNRLITNQHCVENSEQCEAMVIIFGYEFDRRVVRQPGVQYRCAGLLGTPNKELDFTVLEIAQGNRDLSEWGQLELSTELASGKLFIIQHPGGDLKKIVQKDCEVTTRDAENRQGEQNDFGHKCDTEDGSSGSPVFDSMHRVIGLHHLGWEKDIPRWSDENRAVHAHKIRDKIEGR